MLSLIALWIVALFNLVRFLENVSEFSVWSLFSRRYLTALPGKLCRRGEQIGTS